MDTAETRALRNALVDKLKADGYVKSEAAEDALRSVPRHVFIPWRTSEDAYSKTEGAIIDPDTTAATCSTVSQPAAVAMMLEAFDVKPGMRVLEIGAGSGYNAALLACLTGKQGHVLTLDIEDFLVEKARRQLTATGFARVQVVCGDGAHGYAHGAPYDRIVATVGLWDVPQAWAGQLAPGGKIVAPLHLGGAAPDHVLVSLEQRGSHLAGVALASLQMVLFRGDNAGHDEVMLERRGSAWRGLRVDELRVAIYPKDAEVVLEPQQKHLEKSGSVTVLERLTSK